MQRLTRYVLGELLAVFVITLLGMTVIMVLGILAKEVMRQGLGLQPIVRLLPFALPGALRFSIPATILMATCSVYGRMSAHNEVIAIKSLGIPPRVVVLPALGLAFAVSLVAVWLNDVAVTWGTDGIHRVVAESVEDIVYRMLQTQRSYSTSRFSINVKDVDGKRLIRPTVVVRSATGNSVVTLVAREAELRTDLKEETLRILLTDGIIDAGDEVYAFDDTEESVIPLSEATRRQRRKLSPSEIALHRISREIVAQQHRIRQLEQEMTARAAYQIVLGEFPALCDTTWRDLNHEYKDGVGRLNRLHLEPWRRFANGFSCFFFVLVGAPLAIWMKTSNFFTTFAACFVPILFVYYPLLTFAVDRAKDGAVPSYAVVAGESRADVNGIVDHATRESILKPSRKRNQTRTTMAGTTSSRGRGCGNINPKGFCT